MPEKRNFGLSPTESRRISAPNYCVTPLFPHRLRLPPTRPGFMARCVIWEGCLTSLSCIFSPSLLVASPVLTTEDSKGGTIQAWPI